MSEKSVLIDAISGIDEEYLQDYFSYKEKMKTRKTAAKKKRLALLIAACICASAVTFILTYQILNRPPDPYDPVNRVTLPEEGHNENTTSAPKEYDAMILSGMENGVFKDSFIYPEAETRVEEVSDANKSTIRVGAQELVAIKARITYSDRGVTEEYRSEDGERSYRILKNGNSFVIKSVNGAFLQAYSREKLTEESLVKQVKDFILYYLPGERLDVYSLKTRTRVLYQLSDSAWVENVAIIYFPDKDAAGSVSYYTFTFKKSSQGLDTSDLITVLCDRNGNITSMEYHNCGVDWDSVNIDLDLIKERAVEFISGALSEDYTLKKCAFLSASLDQIDSRIRVVATYELTLENKSAGNGEIVVNCPVIITP